MASRRPNFQDTTYHSAAYLFNAQPAVTIDIEGFEVLYQSLFELLARHH